MSKTLFLFLFSYILATAATSVEAQSKSVYLEFERKNNISNSAFDYQSNTVGANYWSNDYAFWGSVEVLQATGPQIDHNDQDKSKLYYELAGELQLGFFRLIPSAAIGSDSRFHPDQSLALEMRYNQSAVLWPYLASVVENYSGTVDSRYTYLRLGNHWLLPVPGLVLNFYIQSIDLKISGGNPPRAGNGQLIALNYFGPAMSAGASAQRGCISDNYSCTGNQRDYYYEYSANLEVKVSNNWALGPTFGYIEQKGIQKNNPASNISNSSNYAKILLRHLF